MMSDSTRCQSASGASARIRSVARAAAVTPYRTDGRCSTTSVPSGWRTDLALLRLGLRGAGFGCLLKQRSQDVEFPHGRGPRTTRTGEGVPRPRKLPDVEPRAPAVRGEHRAGSAAAVRI